jgi:glycosyltransferase involved in cell wall biosynthesis
MICHLTMSKKGVAQGVSTVVDQFELLEQKVSRYFNNENSANSTSSSQTVAKKNRLKDSLISKIKVSFIYLLYMVWISKKNVQTHKDQILQYDIIMCHDVFAVIFANAIKQPHQTICLYNHSDSSPINTLKKVFPGIICAFFIYWVEHAFNKVILDAVYSLSEIANNKFQELNRDEGCFYVVVKNFIQSSKEPLSINSGVPKIWMVGSICPRKRQIEFFSKVEAASIQPSVTFEVAGPCSPSDAEYLNSLSYVNFRGTLQNITSYYQAGDALLSVSEDEGLPMTMIEASSRGMLILSTDVGGCKKICLDNQNGFLFPKEYDLEEVFNSIQMISDDHALREAYTQASLDVFDSTFSEKAAISFWDQEFEKLKAK